MIANDLNNDGKLLTQIVMLSLFSANEFASFLDMYETINIWGVRSHHQWTNIILYKMFVLAVLNINV